MRQNLCLDPLREAYRPVTVKILVRRVEDNKKADLHFCVSEISIILPFQAHKYFLHFMNNVNVAINGEKLIRER